MSVRSVYQFSSLLRKCTTLSEISHARITHAQTLVNGFIINVTLQTDLLLAYSKCGLIQDARKVFDRMSDRNMHSWNIMIASYAQDSLYSDAISVFDEFRKLGFRPDHFTLPPLLKASAGVREVYVGKVLHGWVIRLGLEDYVVVGTSVLEFYLKCGDLVDARRVFNSMLWQDTVACNLMISGYAKAGLCAMAMSCFSNMIGKGVKMDSRTIPSILNACGGEGALMRGKEVHGNIVRSPFFSTDVVIGNSLINMDGVSTMRSKMKELGLTKTPGCSWITIAGVIHKFYQGDCSHPLAQVIAEMLGQMITVLMLPDAFGRGNHI
ncbi:pentatricopeptide repeat-containing protein [Tripterygium wilfordii]|uniref:Pentatricopeptide repeat-containing protein n=1 Tax=Tripterygium wilfordii TaxID=458696 RepID=A0A7J7DFP4_TRIWF|nr:pentatricopeptide repeat-containing protein [Tripterygium wilfordii]